MITTKDFPDKVFESKEELFAELRISAEKIIAVKKAEIHKSLAFTGFLDKELSLTKGAGLAMKDDFVYPIINSTRLMDSHQDVHFDGIWNKSAKEQNGKLFYVTDHEIKIESIIAWPNDVNVIVKSVPWAFVGKSYEGDTEALIYEIPKDKIVHDKAKQIIEQKRPVQNSVRMQYVKIQLGMNSTAKEDIEYKKYYDSKIKLIANKDQVEELGYFWGVEEAKIVTEGSMVIRGSNDATPIQQKENEVDTTIIQDTTKQPEPSTVDEPSQFDWSKTLKETKFINV